MHKYRVAQKLNFLSYPSNEVSYLLYFGQIKNYFRIQLFYKFFHTIVTISSTVLCLYAFNCSIQVCLRFKIHPSLKGGCNQQGQQLRTRACILMGQPTQGSFCTGGTQSGTIRRNCLGQCVGPIFNWSTWSSYGNCIGEFFITS